MSRMKKIKTYLKAYVNKSILLYPIKLISVDNIWRTFSAKLLGFNEKGNLIYCTEMNMAFMKCLFWSTVLIYVYEWMMW